MRKETEEEREAIDAEISVISDLGLADLKQRWAKRRKGNLPKRVSRELLILGVAWDLQTSLAGGLSKDARRRLGAAIASLESTGNVVTEVPIGIKPGTRLVREWQGERHEVTVLEKRYAYKDMQFDSLSEVARKITGTRWSGPVFFGLKKVSRKQAAHA